MRISPVAPPGSLLKAQKEFNRRASRKLHEHAKRRARQRDERHLARVRKCPCLACDNDPAGEAAHLRMSAPGKPVTGTGVKPDDRYALPLCRDCHTRGRGAQHKIGEVRFYQDLGIDPLVVCERLYRASPDVSAMRAECFAAREKRR